MNHPLRVLLVEDSEDDALLVTRKLRQDGFDTVFERVDNSLDTIAALERGCWDIVISDYSMPSFSAPAALALVKERGLDIPFIIVSGHIGEEAAVAAMKAGAHDYLMKDKLARLAPAVQRELQEAEIRQARRRADEEMILRLARAGECRDDETALHVERMSEYCGLLAQRLELNAERCKLIRLASTMHDIGKIGIPDHILRKPGPLTSDEYNQMKEHTIIGHAILAGSKSELLDLAATIALTHHEKYDGSGYPRGIAGSDIPLEGRIAAIADAFDALSSGRIYRPAVSIPQSIQLMYEDRNTHFDPDLLDLLLDSMHEVLSIRNKYTRQT